MLNTYYTNSSNIETSADIFSSYSPTNDIQSFIPSSNSQNEYKTLSDNNFPSTNQNSINYYTDIISPINYDNEPISFNENNIYSSFRPKIDTSLYNENFFPETPKNYSKFKSRSPTVKYTKTFEDDNIEKTETVTRKIRFKNNDDNLNNFIYKKTAKSPKKCFYKKNDDYLYNSITNITQIPTATTVTTLPTTVTTLPPTVTTLPTTVTSLPSTVTTLPPTVICPPIELPTSICTTPATETILNPLDTVFVPQTSIIQNIPTITPVQYTTTYPIIDNSLSPIVQPASYHSNLNDINSNLLSSDKNSNKNDKNKKLNSHSNNLNSDKDDRSSEKTISDFNYKNSKNLSKRNSIKTSIPADELSFGENSHIKFTSLRKSLKSQKPYDYFSQYLFAKINQIRQNPKSYIPKIRQAISKIYKDKRGILVYKDNKIKVALFKGKPAFEEAIIVLQNMEPMDPLIFDPDITLEIPMNKNDFKNGKDLIKKVKEKIDEGKCIKAFWRDLIKDPEVCLLMMIIDDNEIDSSAGSKRRDVLSPKMKYIGINSGGYGNCFVCYMTFSD